MAAADDALNASHIDILKKFVRDIKYGSITIIVQDGKVIQIEKTEKLRIKD